MAGNARASSRAASKADFDTRGTKPLKSGFASMRVKSVTPKAPVLKRSSSVVFKQVQSSSPEEKPNTQPVKKVGPSKSTLYHEQSRCPNVIIEEAV